MKDRMEKLVVLPFSMTMGMGCTSHSSVSVFETNPKKSSKQEPNIPVSTLSRPDQAEENLSVGEKMKRPFTFLPIPKPNISVGIQKLVKSLKSLSQLFVYKDEGEELEMDMEIGTPTDVKHVTHIGWDGSTTNNNNPLMGWDHLKPPELLSIPTLSLRQFELAMAAQADAPVC